MRLTPEEWEEAADLCQQFCDQCEIAFEDVAPHSKKWVLSRLTQLTKIADMRASHPRRSAHAAAKAKMKARPDGR